MRWYSWRWWRIARSRNRGTTYDGFGRWTHVAFGWWWLAGPGEVATRPWDDPL